MNDYTKTYTTAEGIEMTVSLGTLSLLTRKELQALACNVGMKKNVKSDDIRDALRALLIEARDINCARCDASLEATETELKYKSYHEPVTHRDDYIQQTEWLRVDVEQPQAVKCDLENADVMYCNGFYLGASNVVRRIKHMKIQGFKQCAMHQSYAPACDIPDVTVEEVSHTQEEMLDTLHYQAVSYTHTTQGTDTMNTDLQNEVQPRNAMTTDMTYKQLQQEARQLRAEGYEVGKLNAKHEVLLVAVNKALALKNEKLQEKANQQVFGNMPPRHQCGTRVNLMARSKARKAREGADAVTQGKKRSNKVTELQWKDIPAAPTRNTTSKVNYREETRVKREKLDKFAFSH